MATITEIRQQYPQYEDLTDVQLADAFHQKYYTDIPKEEFYSQLKMTAGPAQSASVAQIPTGGDRRPENDLPSQIPTGGYSYRAEEDQRERAQPMSTVEAAMAGAMGVPIVGGTVGALTAISKGTKALPYLQRLQAAVVPASKRGLVAEGIIGAVSGIAANEAANRMPDGWGPVGEVLGGATGGLVGAGSMSTLRNAGTLVRKAPSLFSSSKDLAEQKSSLVGKGAASQQALAAIEANPNLPATIERASEIGANTGINLPMLAASNGDTTISSFLQSEINRGENVAFTAAMKRQYEVAEAALATAKGKAAPSMQEVEAYVKRKAVEVKTVNEKIVARAQAESAERKVDLKRIDERVAELSSELSPTASQTDIGGRLTNLLASKEKIVKSEISPLYTELIANSEKAGIALPKESAKALRDFVTDEAHKDIFNKFPQLYSQIKKVFGPKAIASTRVAEKYRIAKDAGSQNDVALTALDSLKRETNASLRSTQRGSDQHRMLVELKSQVDAAIDTVDPAFSVPYRALDKEYALRVGIPFNEAGVIQIDRARFVEQAVPKMTSTTSGLKQVMDIIGDSKEGLKIVEDAFMYDIGNSRSIMNINTGEMRPVQLAAYMRKNGDKIDMVPGLRKKLEDVSGSVENLLAHRTKIHELEAADQAVLVENMWSKAYGTKDSIKGLVRNALKSPEELDKLVKIAATGANRRSAIKAALLDDILSAPGDRMQLFDAHREAFDSIFGKAQAKHLTDLVEASQRLKDNPFVMHINPATINKSQWEKATGTKATTTFGEWRNQVMSGPRAIINHFGRFFQHKADRSEASEVQRFLLDPASLELASKYVVELNTRGFTERALSMSKDIVKKQGGAWLSGAIVGGAIGSQERNKPVPAYDPLTEGFGQ